MIDADDKIEQPAPEAVVTHYLSSLDDAVEHLRAADLLGFGARLHSYLAPTDEGGYIERWELEVLTESPVRDESEETEADAE